MKFKVDGKKFFDGLKQTAESHPRVVETAVAFTIGLVAGHLI